MTTNYPSAHIAPMVVVILTLITTDDEGTSLTTTTWACGPSEKTAVRTWQKENPVLAPLLRTYEVVTPKQPSLFRDHQRLRLKVWTSKIGERAPVRDMALENAGVGL